MNNSKIWLSGSNGFVGKHLLNYYNKKNITISTLSNTNINSNIFCDYIHYSSNLKKK